MRKIGVLLSLGFLLLSAPVSSRVRGPEMVLNATTRGAQQQPAVAALPNGDFLVVWVDGGQRQTPSSLKARFFTAQGDAELDRLAAEDPIMKLATNILDDISRDFDAYFHAMRLADEIVLDKISYREEGEAKGRAEILLKQLGIRFGRVSDAIRARVERATIAELDTWAERVLTATTLDEVLAP